MINVVFAGSPDFAVPSLKALIRHPNINVPLIITQPDKPAGRKRMLTPTAVKICAEQYDIPVLTPERIDDSYSDILSANPDLMVVVAYGQLLKSRILTLPRLGCLNVHASLLPRWRGAAPIHRAILAGDEETGVSIMKMDEGLDTGPVYLEKKVPITQHDTSATLFQTLSHVGAEALIETIELIEKKHILPQAQSNEGVTYASKITKNEGIIDWRRSAHQIDCQVRAFTPWPGSTTTLNGQKIRINKVGVQVQDNTALPGEIIAITPEAIIVACGQDAILVRELQSPGRTSLTVKEWLNGNELTKNDRFEF